MLPWAKQFSQYFLTCEERRANNLQLTLVKIVALVATVNAARLLQAAES